MNGNIEVYMADVSPLMDTGRFRRLYDRVSAGRKEKTDRMKFMKDKCLSLGAGALLESALAAEGIHDFTMATTQNAKPCLLHYPDVHFNLSHSGTKVMCAVSDAEIGCDVEEVNEISMEIARRFFFAEEYAALMHCTGDESRQDLFFRYWTLKESFMKATGLGFRLSLDQFCILLDGSMIAVRQSVDTRSYYFREFSLDDGYKYAVCSVDKPVNEVRIHRETFCQVP